MPKVPNTSDPNKHSKNDPSAVYRQLLNNTKKKPSADQAMHGVVFVLSASDVLFMATSSTSSATTTNTTTKLASSEVPVSESNANINGDMLLRRVASILRALEERGRERILSI